MHQQLNQHLIYLIQQERNSHTLSSMCFCCRQIEHRFHQPHFCFRLLDNTFCFRYTFVFQGAVYISVTKGLFWLSHYFCEPEADIGLLMQKSNNRKTERAGKGTQIEMVMISVMVRLVFQVILFLFAAVYTVQECALHPAFFAHKRIIDITVHNNIHMRKNIICYDSL